MIYHVTNKRRDRAELRDTLSLTNSKNYDTGRGEGVKLERQLQKLFGMRKVVIRNYITFRKHFKRALFGNFFTISNVP